MTTKDLNLKMRVDNEFNITEERIEHVITVKMSSTIGDALVLPNPQEWITAFQPGWDRILSHIAENYTENGDNVHFFLGDTEITMEELLSRLDDEHDEHESDDTIDINAINDLADLMDQEETDGDTCGCIICRMMRDLKENAGEDR